MARSAPPASVQLRGARVRAGLSQAALARRAGTSQSAVSRYEQGAMRPSPRTMQRLLQACRARRPSRLLAERRGAVLEAARRRGAVRVLVFGSVARNEDGPRSDIDLLVEFPPGTTTVPDAAGRPWSLLLGLLDLQAELQDILGAPVDLGLPEMLRRDVAETVLAHARPL